MKVKAILILTVALSACATDYTDRSASGYFWLGGVTLEPVSDTRVVVRSRGNAFTSALTIDRYAMRRAAEEATARGFIYFIVLRERDDGPAQRAFGGNAPETETLVEFTNDDSQMPGKFAASEWR